MSDKDPNPLCPPEQPSDWQSLTDAERFARLTPAPSRPILPRFLGPCPECAEPTHLRLGCTNDDCPHGFGFGKGAE